MCPGIGPDGAGMEAGGGIAAPPDDDFEPDMRETNTTSALITQTHHAPVHYTRSVRAVRYRGVILNIKCGVEHS